MVNIKVESLFYGTLYVIDGSVEDLRIRDSVNSNDLEYLFKLKEWKVDEELYFELKELADILWKENHKLCITYEGDFFLEGKNQIATNSENIVERFSLDK